MESKKCEHCNHQSDCDWITVSDSTAEFYFCCYECLVSWCKEEKPGVSNYSEKCATCYARFDEYECDMPCANCEFEELGSDQEPCKGCKEENCKFQDRRN